MATQSHPRVSTRCSEVMPHIIRKGRMPKKLTLQTGVIFLGFARVLLDFSQVQSVKTLGNFAHGNVNDGLDGGGIDDRNGAGGGV